MPVHALAHLATPLQSPLAIVLLCPAFPFSSSHFYLGAELGASFQKHTLRAQNAPRAGDCQGEKAESWERMREGFREEVALELGQQPQGDGEEGHVNWREKCGQSLKGRRAGTRP